jgi:hypothetical protein
MLRNPGLEIFGVLRSYRDELLLTLYSIRVHLDFLFSRSGL